MTWRFVRADTNIFPPETEICLQGVALDSPASEIPFLQLLRLRLASDEDLAEALKAGNADALAILFKRHSRLLFATARRILRNDAEAEDTVQQIFLDVFRSIRQFDRTKGVFKNWLLMFAYQRMFNSRRSQIASRYFETDSLDEGMPNASPAASQRYSAAEDSILVEQILQTLQPRQRRTIELIYREGCTAEEVSVLTGESVRVVRHNLYRGLEKLRKSLCATTPVKQQPARRVR